MAGVPYKYIRFFSDILKVLPEVCLARTAFRAGAPHYGVSDMRKLDEVLHKFEYYPCDWLMCGTWEECEPVWRA
jgi:hypothetical protein